MFSHSGTGQPYRIAHGRYCSVLTDNARVKALFEIQQFFALISTQIGYWNAGQTCDGIRNVLGAHLF
jgi:hypothetical protein